MILVIDNYDSFTWNLVHYLMELGAEVEVVRGRMRAFSQAVRSGAVKGATMLQRLVKDVRQIAANTGGTVTVNADSTVASSGALISTGTRSPAAFDVVGSPNAMVVVSLPASPVDLTRSGGTETMSLGGFNTNPNGAFQLDASGNGAFNVGGTLSVASGQVPGAYSGTFVVSVEYQ